MLKNKVSDKDRPTINNWVIEQQNVLNEKFTAIGTGGSINKIYNLSNNSIGKASKPYRS